MSHAAAKRSADAYNALAVREGWPSICDHTLAFEQPELAAVLAVWRQAAGAKSLPTRADISPRLLKRFLKDAAIYERVTAESGACRYRVRVIGMAFAAVMGDITGKFVDDVVGPTFVSRWNSSLDATISAGAPLRFLGRSDTANKSFLVAEYFSAPLIGRDGTPSMVLGVGRFDGSRKWDSVAADARAKLHLDEYPAAPV